MLTRRTFLSTTCFAVLSACTARGTFIAPRAGQVVNAVDVIAVSNRTDLNTTDRDTQLRFANLRIGIPKDHVVGDVPASGDGAFTLLDQRAISSKSDLAAALGPVGTAPLVIWVHGFNNTAAEAVNRQAQMAFDAELRGPQVSFVWPSAESPGGYLYDRDSALQARTALEDLLDIIADVWDGETVVIAHSLGCLLVMEALARLSLRGRPSKLKGLLLLHPDVSPAVFASLVRDIEPLPHNSLLVISRDDPALRVSALFSRSEERVGMTTDPADYRELGFDILDLTDQADATNPHLTALTSPTVLDRLRAIANR